VRAFTCGNCGQLVFFENSLCLRCSSPLGFLPSRMQIAVIDQLPPGAARCANAVVAECNWLVEDGDPSGLCASCRLTRTRPGDGDAEGLALFARAEGAKRRLVFQLLDLRLPIGAALGFDLLWNTAEPVMTGHEDGLITVDLTESDDARREQRRAELSEPYRTLLGHFRHEIGHYYWPLIVAQTGALERFRELFGDERESYEDALQRHYDSGPPADWSQRHVSVYATMHPWEDWAETWAHYLHIRDTLQTAAAFGLVVAGPGVTLDPSLTSAPGGDQGYRPFQAIIDEWLPLTYALNQVNRSMGRGDLYPFTLAPTVIEKLAFVDERVLAGAPAPAS
jgi:hypothetical protein